MLSNTKVVYGITATFNNMLTPKFKAQPTNVFLGTVNQMFGAFVGEALNFRVRMFLKGRVKGSLQ